VTDDSIIRGCETNVLLSGGKNDQGLHHTLRDDQCFRILAARLSSLVRIQGQACRSCCYS